MAKNKKEINEPDDLIEQLKKLFGIVNGGIFPTLDIGGSWINVVDGNTQYQIYRGNEDPSDQYARPEYDPWDNLESESPQYKWEVIKKKQVEKSDVKAILLEKICEFCKVKNIRNVLNSKNWNEELNNKILKIYQYNNPKMKNIVKKYKIDLNQIIQLQKFLQTVQTAITNKQL